MGILGAMDDPFDDLPQEQLNKKPWPVDIGPWVKLIENSRRQPAPLLAPKKETPPQPPSRLLEWRSFSSSLGFAQNVAEVPTNFNRDLKHLDQTCSREVHKVPFVPVPVQSSDFRWP